MSRTKWDTALTASDVKKKTHGRDYVPFYTKGPRTTYEEKVAIVKKLLEDKPDINSRQRITNITGIRSDVLNLMEKNGDVTNLPKKLKKGHHRWTNTLGVLSTKKYGR